MNEPINPKAELRELFMRASALAGELGLDLDDYMRLAWQSYMDVRPGLREQLEDIRLAAEIEAMRVAGKVGIA
jgi:hypothetical protein